MDNKKLGIILIIIAVLLGAMFGIFKYEAEKDILSQVTLGPDGGCMHPEGTICPFQQLNRLVAPTYVIIALLVLIAGLGIYLMFFEKSQREMITTLKETKKQKSDEERFSILLSGLDENEKKTMVAVREQDGITQSTLKLRVDMSKTKLSIILAGLEKKGLIKKVAKGRTNKIFLKKAV